MLALNAGSVGAQHRGVLVPLPRPYFDPAAMPLYPDAQIDSKAEAEIWMSAPNDLVARNVSVPTITPVLPARGAATGAAVVVLPGGGNVVVSMQKEGYDVARFLAGQGIAAFVVKYRVQQTPADIAEMRARISAAAAGDAHAAKPPAPTDGSELGIADAKQAMNWVRTRANEYGIDPERVGIIAFSAGAGHLWGVLMDENPSVRPAFAAPFYGGFQTRPIAPGTPPPLFLAAAADDPVLPQVSGFPIFEQWTTAGGKVEMHLYQSGGHGFGGFKQGTTSDLAMEEFVLWLKSNGMLNRKR